MHLFNLTKHVATYSDEVKSIIYDYLQSLFAILIFKFSEFANFFKVQNHSIIPIISGSVKTSDTKSFGSFSAGVITTF